MSTHSVAFSSNKSGSQAWFTMRKSYLKSSGVYFFNHLTLQDTLTSRLIHEELKSYILSSR